jgi:hypothetical protein
MLIVYTGPHAEVRLDGVVCKHGEAVEFPDLIARRALEQSCWTDPATHGAPAKGSGVGATTKKAK